MPIATDMLRSNHIQPPILHLKVFSIPGGAMSNLYGVLLARHKFFPDAKVNGHPSKYTPRSKLLNPSALGGWP